jgi:transcription initiation factor TFIID TATA-box-binding protein
MVMTKEEIKVKYKIENIVASAELNIQIDLFRIAREQRNVEYEPEQFPGAILKLKEPRASLLLFKNGKLICTGTKSESDVKKALEAAVKILSKYRIREKK